MTTTQPTTDPTAATTAETPIPDNGDAGAVPPMPVGIYDVVRKSLRGATVDGQSVRQAVDLVWPVAFAAGRATAGSSRTAAGDPLVAALAAGFTPDALHDFAEVIGRRVGLDDSGGPYRRMERALRAAETASLARVTTGEQTAVGQ